MADTNDNDPSGDMVFFCLFWLRMNPRQIADMLYPGDVWNATGCALLIADRWAQATAYAAARGSFRH